MTASQHSQTERCRVAWSDAAFSCVLAAEVCEVMLGGRNQGDGLRRDLDRDLLCRHDGEVDDPAYGAPRQRERGRRDRASVVEQVGEALGVDLGRNEPMEGHRSTLRVTRQ